MRGRPKKNTRNHPLTRLSLLYLPFVPRLGNEWIGLPLLADRGQRSVPGHHNDFIRQCHQLSVQGSNDLVVVPAGEVGAPDASGKERIAGYQLLLAFKIKTHAALGV